MNYILKHINPKHPNRPGYKLKGLKAIVVHYTQNDIPQADALFHYQYINRPYIIKYNEQKKAIFFEKNGITPFRFGSAHVFCDMNTIVETIPLDEVAWSCGDKNYNGGYKPVAYSVFQGQQNFYTINVEICNNDVIKNSTEDWEKSVENAKLFIKNFIQQHNFTIDIEKSLQPQSILPHSLTSQTILLLRHFDITGKICPKPFIDSLQTWRNFVLSFTT